MSASFDFLQTVSFTDGGGKTRSLLEELRYEQARIVQQSDPQ